MADTLAEMRNLFIDAAKAANASVILDIGSRDGDQAVEFKQALPDAEVIAFECHPDLVRQFTKGIRLVKKAVTNVTGTVPFYAIFQSNKGASSLFEPKDRILPWDDTPRYNEVEVEATRIDDWAREAGIKQIDAVWMDIQGAELLALEGFGSMLDTVKVIATEVEVKPVYEGKPAQFEELIPFLLNRGFSMVKFLPSWEKEADVLFIKGEQL